MAPWVARHLERALLVDQRSENQEVLAHLPALHSLFWEKDGVRLRHALEVRNPTFACQEFHDLAAKYGAAIVYAVDDEEPTWPQIDEATADFSYARLMSSREDEPTGMTSDELDAVARQTRAWAERGDVFAYFISGAKVRNPAAAQALIAKLK